MREVICSSESAAATAARTGLWNDAVRDHVATCLLCQEVVVTISHLRSLAEERDEAPGLDAAWLWRKALLERKQAEAERIHRPLLILEALAIPVVLLLATLLMAWVSAASAALSLEMLASVLSSSVLA